MPVENAPQLFVADERLEIVKTVRVRLRGKRRLTACAARQLAQLIEEQPRGSRFFVGLHWHARLAQELTQFQPLVGVYRGALHPKVRRRDLPLVQLSRCQRRAVQRRSKVAGREQADERGVDRVARPAVGRASEVRADVAASSPATDERQNGTAHCVVLGLALVIHSFKRVRRTFASALDHCAPARVVGLPELVEQPVERCLPPCVNLVGKARLWQFRAATLICLRSGDDLPDQRPQAVLRLRKSSFHALAGFDSFRSRRNTLVVERPLRTIAHCNDALQRVRPRPRYEHMNRGVVGTCRTRVVNYVLSGCAPAVPYPDRDFAASGVRRFRTEVRGELTRFLAGALRQPRRTDRSLHGVVQDLRPYGSDAGWIVHQPALARAKLRLPLAALARLKAVFLMKLHQRPRFDELVEQARNPTSKHGAIPRQV